MAEYESLNAPVLDISAPVALNTSEQRIYEHQVAGDAERITELSVFGDSSFATYGKVKVLVKGKVCTSGGFISVISSILGFTVNWAGSQIVLNRNEKVEVWAYVTTGVANAQVQLTGELVRRKA